jgi:predicted SAM-dependent methyltransferase
MNSTEKSGCKINLGCWKFKIPDWINIDIDPNFGDITADVRKLPFDDDTVDEIYAGHLLEHFAPGEHAALLNEWKRVLTKDGKLTVTVPDIRKSLDLVMQGKMTLELLADAVYGRHDRPEQVHKCAFDSEVAQAILKTYFRDITVLERTSLAPFNVPWQTIIECKK